MAVLTKDEKTFPIVERYSCPLQLFHLSNNFMFDAPPNKRKTISFWLIC